jgi:hypothetical protein
MSETKFNQKLQKLYATKIKDWSDLAPFIKKLESILISNVTYNIENSNMFVKMLLQIFNANVPSGIHQRMLVLIDKILINKTTAALIFLPLIATFHYLNSNSKVNFITIINKYYIDKLSENDKYILLITLFNEDEYSSIYPEIIKIVEKLNCDNILIQLFIKNQNINILKYIVTISSKFSISIINNIIEQSFIKEVDEVKKEILQLALKIDANNITDQNMIQIIKYSVINKFANRIIKFDDPKIINLVNNIIQNDTKYFNIPTQLHDNTLIKMLKDRSGYILNQEQINNIVNFLDITDLIYIMNNYEYCDNYSNKLITLALSKIAGRRDLVYHLGRYVVNNCEHINFQTYSLDDNNEHAIFACIIGKAHENIKLSIFELYDVYTNFPETNLGQIIINRIKKNKITVESAKILYNIYQIEGNKINVGENNNNILAYSDYLNYSNEYINILINSESVQQIITYKINLCTSGNINLHNEVLNINNICSAINNLKVNDVQLTFAVFEYLIKAINFDLTMVTNQLYRMVSQPFLVTLPERKIMQLQILNLMQSTDSYDLVKIFTLILPIVDDEVKTILDKFIIENIEKCNVTIINILFKANITNLNYDGYLTLIEDCFDIYYLENIAGYNLSKNSFKLLISKANINILKKLFLNNCELFMYVLFEYNIVNECVGEFIELWLDKKADNAELLVKYLEYCTVNNMYSEQFSKSIVKYVKYIGILGYLKNMQVDESVVCNYINIHLNNLDCSHIIFLIKKYNCGRKYLQYITSNIDIMDLYFNNLSTKDNVVSYKKIVKVVEQNKENIKILNRVVPLYDMELLLIDWLNKNLIEYVCIALNIINCSTVESAVINYIYRNWDKLSVTDELCLIMFKKFSSNRMAILFPLIFNYIVTSKSEKFIKACGESNVDTLQILYYYFK